ncbi:MAG TPA: type III pantothenate kinase [Gemmata sp.]
MTPDVVVDIGNTRIKFGRCAGGQVSEMVSLPGDRPDGWEAQLTQWAVRAPVTWAVASVQPEWHAQFAHWAEARGDHVFTVTHEHVPVPTDVTERNKVGIDRLLNALAALVRVPAGWPVIVVAVGTAMTVDYIDPAGVFRGGAILPGPWMMAHALHEFTAKLPLVEPPVFDPDRPVGRNTREAIELGIQSAIFGAADTLVWNMSQLTDLKPLLFVTGGGADFVRGIGFTADLEGAVFDPHLTLDGVRLAAESVHE